MASRAFIQPEQEQRSAIACAIFDEGLNDMRKAVPEVGAPAFWRATALKSASFARDNQTPLVLLEI